MIFAALNTILAFAPPPAQPGTAPNATGNAVYTFGMFIIMGFMLYFVMIRPTQKKAKEHAALMAALKAGDKIVTSSGIVGIVISVKDKTVSIRSADAKLDILKSAVSEITEKAGGTTES